jgi:hypothetical protein
VNEDCCTNFILLGTIRLKKDVPPKTTVVTLFTATALVLILSKSLP